MKNCSVDLVRQFINTYTWDKISQASLFVWEREDSFWGSNSVRLSEEDNS